MKTFLIVLWLLTGWISFFNIFKDYYNDMNRTHRYGFKPKWHFGDYLYLALVLIGCLGIGPLSLILISNKW